MPEARLPFRLLHLMSLVAAIALTLTVPPAFMKAVMRSFGPVSSWNRAMYLDGVITLALVTWTAVLAPSVLVAYRSRLREAARSYATSAVFASGSALGFLFAARTVQTLTRWWRTGWPIEWYFLDTWLQVLGGMLHEIPGIPAAAIVAVWSTLVLTGVGRKPSGWLEFSYLIFGSCWILWALGGNLVYLINIPWFGSDTTTLW
jgi:hypothetical protein